MQEMAVGSLEARPWWLTGMECRMASETSCSTHCQPAGSVPSARTTGRRWTEYSLFYGPAFRGGTCRSATVRTPPAMTATTVGAKRKLVRDLGAPSKLYGWGQRSGRLRCQLPANTDDRLLSSSCVSPCDRIALRRKFPATGEYCFGTSGKNFFCTDHCWPTSKPARPRSRTRPTTPTTFSAGSPTPERPPSSPPGATARSHKCSTPRFTRRANWSIHSSVETKRYVESPPDRAVKLETSRPRQPSRQRAV